jgi:hypothetical protein
MVIKRKLKKNRETNLKGSHPEINRGTEARRQPLTSNCPYVFMASSFNTVETAVLRNNIYEFSSCLTGNIT